MEPEKLQLPKIRKILHTNLVDISCFVDMNYFNNLRNSSKPKDSFTRIKSNQQSPKISQTAKEITLKEVKKPTKDSIQSVSKDFDVNRGTGSKRLKLSFYRYFDMQPDERLLTSSPSIKRGLSGYTISKLYKSRFQIKNRSRF